MSQNEIKKLTAEWDEKLRQSGFEDIEDRRTGLLKSWSGNSMSLFEKEHEGPPRAPRSSPASDAHREYYRLAQQITFKLKGRDRAIWGLHAEGMALSCIGERLGISKSLAQCYVDKIKAKYLQVYTGAHRHKKRS